MQDANSSFNTTSRSEADAKYKEDLKIAIALSSSEAKEPKPNIHPNSRSAYALAKEEERMVKEAIVASISEQKARVLDREVVPLSELRSPLLPTVDDSVELPELV